MDTIRFDISSETNQNAVADLENQKKEGWKVTDTKRDPENKDILLVVLKEPPFGG